MKARVPGTKANSGNGNKTIQEVANSGILLSIGMIVKNEHKHIRNCLEALQVLRDAIPTQLIIADTGSTDDTFEIAKEFVQNPKDEVYSFEWTGDFSEARNNTLAKAKGLWYMFIDADEYLDKDISEMVKFLTDVKNPYFAATYIVRNYDPGLKFYSDFPAVRMARNVPSLEFTGRIHEGLCVPNKFFDVKTVVHHYGYAYQNNIERQAKWQRNMELMLKEYEQRPKDVRLLAHLADSCSMEERKEYLLKGIEICREKGIDPKHQSEEMLYRGRLFLNLCQNVLPREQNYQEQYEYGKEYFSIDIYKNCYAAIDMYPNFAEACLQLEKFEESAAAYEEYFKVYKKYHNHELLPFDLAVHSTLEQLPYQYALHQYRCGVAYAKSGNFARAIELLESVNVGDIVLNTYMDFLVGVNMIMEHSRAFSHYVNIYRNVEKTGDKYMIDTFIDMTETYYRKHPADREAFINQIADTNQTDIPFVRLMKLMQKDLQIRKTEINCVIIDRDNATGVKTEIKPATEGFENNKEHFLGKSDDRKLDAFGNMVDSTEEESAEDKSKNFLESLINKVEKAENSENGQNNSAQNGNNTNNTAVADIADVMADLKRKIAISKGEVVEEVTAGNAENGNVDNQKLKEELKEGISEYLNSIPAFTTGNMEAVYLALKYKVYAPELFRKTEHQRVQLTVTDLFSVHADEIQKLVCDYCDNEIFSSNTGEVFWGTTMLYFVVKRVGNRDFDEKYALYTQFGWYLAAFVFNAYNIDILTDEDTNLLPPLYHFGYYYGKAITAENDGDLIEYIRNIKEGLIYCDEMSDLVAVLAKKFQDNLRG